MFISVISKHNEAKALDHLFLAKKLNTKCKINGMMPIGKSTEFYPMHKLLNILLTINESDYSQYLAMDNVLYNGGCNFNTSLLCKSTIRAVYVDDFGNLQCGSCEDQLADGITIPANEIICTPTKEKLSSSQTVCKECQLCELFYLCNGCRQYRKMNRFTKNHCYEMKKLLPRIIQAKWKIQP